MRPRTIVYLIAAAALGAAVLERLVPEQEASEPGEPSVQGVLERAREITREAADAR